MTVTHYQSSSKGPVEIASMNPHHAANALDKLQREGRPGVAHPRQAEIDALNAHVSAMAEQEAEALVNGG